MGQHSAEDRAAGKDPGNTGPDELTEELTADELDAILARFHTGAPFDAGGALPAGMAVAYNDTGEDERISRQPGDAR